MFGWAFNRRAHHPLPVFLHIEPPPALIMPQTGPQHVPPCRPRQFISSFSALEAGRNEDHPCGEWIPSRLICRGSKHNCGYFCWLAPDLLADAEQRVLAATADIWASRLYVIAKDRSAPRYKVIGHVSSAAQERSNVFGDFGWCCVEVAVCRLSKYRLSETGNST
ncbi:hypothetical protein B0H19DRAFT_1067612 [Mycena capillaripes]|nr:hypothetical protein B0H19DRAFT_1067612 [Mycena capillaripes]